MTATKKFARSPEETSQFSGAFIGGSRPRPKLQYGTDDTAPKCTLLSILNRQQIDTFSPLVPRGSCRKSYKTTVPIWSLEVTEWEQRAFYDFDRIENCFLSRALWNSNKFDFCRSVAYCGTK
jgi:hypothetical protein